MANITEELNNPQWAEGIYQLETTDPRPLQNTSLNLFADSRNPNTDFRLFSFQIFTDFTQIPP